MARYIVCLNNGSDDVMVGRTYLIRAVDVVRECHPHWYGTAVRHRISREQAASEIRSLRACGQYVIRRGGN